MSLFVMADLHLSTNENTGKSMDVFGRRWQGYTQKIEKNWRAVVNEGDTVVIPGDISWAMNTDEARSDLLFLDSLPGNKIISKGNHDFWWTTVKKMNGFFAENSISTVKFLYNNAHETDEAIICGSRGWFNDESFQNTVGGTSVDYGRIVAREVIRLSLSLDCGVALKGDSEKEMIAFLHFPPVYGDFVCWEIIEVLKKYGIRRCYYGHIHGNYFIPPSFEFEGIQFIIAASDFLNFSPLPVYF